MVVMISISREFAHEIGHCIVDWLKLPAQFVVDTLREFFRCAGASGNNIFIYIRVF